MSEARDARASGRAALSVLLVVRDEVDRLPAALDSVAWADDVVVVDTGSADGTPERAVRAGARVVRAPWEGFVVSRNRSLRHARHDWVLMLDADERVTPELRREIEGAIRAEGSAAGYTMPRLSSFLGRPIRHGTWYPDRVLRLVRRSARARWEGGRVHERCAVDGPVGALGSELLHHPYRDLGHALEKALQYARLKSEDWRDRGRVASLGSVLVRPWLEFLRFYVLKAGMLDGVPGLLAALLHAHSYFLAGALAYAARRGRPPLGEPEAVPVRAPRSSATGPVRTVGAATAPS